MQSPSQRRPYDRESSALHPEIALHRQLATTSMEVYFSIDRSELLYSRLAAESPFVAQVQVQVGDTTWFLLDTAWNDTPSVLRAQWTATPQELPTWVDIQVTDVLRNTAWQERRLVGSTEALGANDILAWSQSEAWPLAGSHASVGDTLLLYLPQAVPSESPLAGLWSVLQVEPPAGLPPPPFSGSRPRWDTLTSRLLGELKADSLLVLVVPEGATVLECEANNLRRIFFAHDAHFPELASAESLVAPTRYIASRAEHQRMKEADHPKLALDEFWLACGDSPDHARELLETYYGRVEEANHAFSGLVEGWKSDRGMVHIVFGVPQRVRRDSWNEYWTYGEEGTSNALTFHFRRKANPWDNGHFVLQRSMQYRSLWDRAVSNWRNGRVRAD